MPPPADTSLRGLRALLVLVAVLVVAFGAVARWVQPSIAPGFPFRFAIAGVCLGIVVGTYRSPWFREHARSLGIAVGWLLYAYFMHRAVGAAIGPAHALGLILIVAVQVSLLRTRTEVAVYGAGVGALTTLAYGSVDQPIVPFAMYAAALAALVVLLATIALSRARLEDELRHATGALEARVAERTDALTTEVRERRHAELRAIEASEAKSRFLATMSHELRTPLNAVIGYTELVLESLDEREVDAQEDLAHVLSSARHLLQMVTDMLDIARIESGTIALDCQPIALADLADEVVLRLRPRARRAPISLEVDAPATAWADRLRTVQILTNLVDNALKFTEAGTVRVRVRVDGTWAVVDVIDTGVGIPAEAAERVFDRFVQLDPTSTRRHGGAGLGLALSRELARAQGGDLEVRSRAGHGSTFTLRLPSERRAAAPDGSG